MTEDTSPLEQTPLLRIVSPNATAEEVAALVAVLTSLGGGSAPAPRRTPEWQASHRRLREPHRPGPGAWRASSLPR